MADEHEGMINAVELGTPSNTDRCTLGSVKRRDLEKRLTECGWHFHRSGGRHDVWTDGEREEPVPRHREINERLAQAILRRACKDRT
jgi:mRNA interferase HicA